MTITPAATEKLKSLCESNNATYVRPFVRGTGCSGMVHGMTFTEEKEERDREITPYVLIDPVAYQFMSNATIDYDITGLSPVFVFDGIFKGKSGTGACGGCAMAG